MTAPAAPAGPAGLHCVVYVSSAVPAMGTPQLEDLLAEARRLNRTNHISGVLLYCDGSFMQYFEGEAAAMAETYVRIRNSRRHTGLIELLNAPVAARQFGSWYMGLSRPTPSDLLALSSAEWCARQAQVDTDRASSPGLLLLREFWSRQAFVF